MERDMLKMVEAELHLEVTREDLDRALGDESVYDVAESILARKPELSDATRHYLMMRGLADFLNEGADFAAEMQRPD